MQKLVRITTVPMSLSILLRGQLRFMSQYFDVLAISSPGAELNEVGNVEGVKTVAIHMTRTISPIRDLIALYKLTRLLKAQNPDIVHTHTPKAGLLGMLAAWLAKVPKRYHTVAGLPLLETSGLKYKLLAFTERITYACATRVYPNSHQLSKIIADNKWCEHGKLKVLGNGSSNGIDTRYFSINDDIRYAAARIRQEFDIANDDFVFLFIGRIVRQKGIDELVTAFQKLASNGAKVKLLLVGPFEDELDPVSPGTRKLIETNTGIIVTGFQMDVRPYIAASNALVFPSYREGFPNVPMQAGCLGIPCIVSNINGCNEIIIHNKNGLIVPAKEVDALYEAMKLLITDKAIYLSLMANARQMIVDRFDQQVMWDLLLKEYTGKEKSTGKAILELHPANNE